MATSSSKKVARHAGIAPDQAISRSQIRCPFAQWLQLVPGWEDLTEAVRREGAGRTLRRILAFLGPAFLVSVGYMDPGNWATDLEGGARFSYSLSQ